MIMDLPPVHYVTSPAAIQMQFAGNEKLNEVKRGIMIDRLLSQDNEPETIREMISLYTTTESEKVKNKIVEGLMLYNQRSINAASDSLSSTDDRLLLKSFFAKLLNEENMTESMLDHGLRGYIDSHTTDELIHNMDKISEKLIMVNHYSSVMLKYAIIHKSPELQKIYIKSIIEELRNVNSADLDSYLFGPLSLAYSTGIDILDPESKQVVMEYLQEVYDKYTEEGIQEHPEDFHRGITSPYYFQLRSAILQSL